MKSRRGKLRGCLGFELRELGELELELADDVGHGAGLFEEGSLAKGTDHVAEGEGRGARLRNVSASISNR